LWSGIEVVKGAEKEEEKKKKRREDGGENDGHPFIPAGSIAGGG